MFNKVTPNLKLKFGEIRNTMAALTRTTTFKVAFGFAALFSTFSLLLMGYIFINTVGVLSYDADRSARQEMGELIRIWETKGADALNSVVVERAFYTQDSLYLLITPEGTILSGNIDSIPMDLSKITRPERGESFRKLPLYAKGFAYRRDDNVKQQRAARGVFVAGPDGYGLFVAHDLGPGYVLAERVVNAVWTGSIAILAFAIIGGYIVARSAAKRVYELSRTTKMVMAGNLSERAPIRITPLGEGDEFDMLASDLNAMLDRTEKLIQSSRTIGDSIAHDLRSPLTRLRAKLEDADIYAKTEDELHEAVVNAIVELDKIVATFNGVLRLSRLEAGQGGHFELVNISDVLSEVVELFEPSVEDKGLEFEVNISNNLMALVDTSMFIQGITNLLDNAIKYTNDGKIIFEAKTIGKNIEISVADSGIGIPESQRENALKRFVRLDSARSTQGTGIGLSLAQAIAEAHKGHLKLEDGIVIDGRVGLKVVFLLPQANAK